MVGVVVIDGVGDGDVRSDGGGGGGVTGSCVGNGGVAGGVGVCSVYVGYDVNWCGVDVVCAVYCGVGDVGTVMSVGVGVCCECWCW